MMIREESGKELIVGELYVANNRISFDNWQPTHINSGDWFIYFGEKQFGTGPSNCDGMFLTKKGLLFNTNLSAISILYWPTNIPFRIV